MSATDAEHNRGLQPHLRLQPHAHQLGDTEPRTEAEPSEEHHALDDPIPLGVTKLQPYHPLYARV